MKTTYKDIVDNLQEDKIIKLMASLGSLDYKDNDTTIQFRTICHNESGENASLKLYYYKDSHRFYCYTHCGALSIFDLLIHFYETRNIDYDWYPDVWEVALKASQLQNNNFSYTPTNPLGDLKARFRKITPNISPSINTGLLECFTPAYYQGWIDEGISIDTMKRHNILLSINQNKIIIPHYNVDGELIGIRGRALDKEEELNFGKYAPVQLENIWYSHQLGLNLYGLDKNKETIARTGIAWVVEGEKSVLIADSFSMPNCAVAVCGNNLAPLQVRLLLQHCHPREIVICFDSEELPHEDRYFNRLHRIATRYKNYCQMSFIYDREKLLQLKDSPVDKGEAVFEQLLKKRKIV